MEQTRTSWLQKAVAIIAGIAVAMCLAIGFAPAKAWALVTGVDITITLNSQIRIDIKGSITDGSEVQYYGDNKYGVTGTYKNVSGDDGGSFKIEVSDGKLVSCNSTTARSLIDADMNKLKAFLTPEGKTVDVTGPNVSIKEVVYNAPGAGLTTFYPSVDDLVNAYIAAGNTVGSVRIEEYYVLEVSGSATVEADFTNYKMTSGDGATWTKGSTEGLTFVSEAPFAEFHPDSVVVDDVQLDSKYWTVEAGSTKLTLKPEYLETLAPKDGYRLAFSSDNGISNATFNVKAASTTDDKTGTNDEKTSPKTGVETAPLAATTLVFAIGALVAGAYIFRTRKEGVK